jgi:hypothetical protein
MPTYSKTVIVIASLAFTAILPGSRALAQSPVGETSSRVIPGWVFTPTVSIGVTHDDNPVLAGRGDPSPDDLVTNVRPGVDLSFTAKHLFFAGGYRGGIQRYRELDLYDNYNQAGYVEFRQQASRRISLSLRDNFSISPTTDLVEVAGVPFTRTGTRQNDLDAVMTSALTKTIQLTGSYHFQWVEFDNPDPIAPLLQGGRAHSVTIRAHKALNSRLRLGGTYGARRAKTGPAAGAEDFTIQDAQATVSYDLGATLTMEGGLGISHLALPEPEGARTGPAGQVSIRKETEYARFILSARRSYVPAFGFGGSVDNQEVMGSVRLPFWRNRAYSNSSVAWRQTDTVFPGEVGVKSIWLQTTLAYFFQPWLRLEGFYNGSFQDSSLPGGRVDRNQIGVQIISAHPMRLR